MPPSSRSTLFGRALGIGARLAKQRILPPLPAPPSPAQRQAATQARLRQGEAIGRQTRTLVGSSRKVARGSSHFGAALWNPFAHAGGILWLEVTGMFFAMFALLFAQHLWTIRAAYRFGPEHAHFLIYSAFTLLFLYFAASSFLRARHRTRRKP